MRRGPKYWLGVTFVAAPASLALGIVFVVIASEWGIASSLGVCLGALIVGSGVIWLCEVGLDLMEEDERGGK